MRASSIHRARAAALGLSIVLVAPASLAQEAPYLGVVVQEDAPLRAAAGPLYYVVGRMEAGTVIEVKDVLFNWSQIDAPAGVRSYVPRRDIDRRGDGSTGIVNTDYVVARAVSIDEDTREDPAESYIEHAYLRDGDTVNIIDTVGEFFLIESPGSAYVFLEPDAVRAATPAEVAQYEAAQAGATTPAGDTPDIPDTPETTNTGEPDGAAVTTDTPDTGTEPADPGTTEATPDTTATDNTETPDTPAAPIVPPDTTNTGGTAEPTPPDTTAVDTPPAAPAAPALDAVEQQMLPHFLKPVEEQPLDAMQAAYDAVAADDTLSERDRALVGNRLAVIAENRELATAIAELRDARARIDQDVRDGTLVPEDARPAQRPDQFDAIGMVMASSLYDGTNLPRLYRLVDPSTKRTIAYVEPAGLGLENHVGQIVGLAGDDAYDASLRRRVFTPTFVEPIRPEGEPTPAEDTVADAGE